MPIIHQTYHSPNSSARRQPVRCLVLHATVGGFAGSVAWLCNPASKVSAHFIIDTDGGIFQLVEEQRVAWHAGRSEWRGAGDVNQFSIGIELVHPNDAHTPHDPRQLDACEWLCATLMAGYGLTPNEITTHALIATPPGRKTDPAALDLKAFRQRFAVINPILGAATGTEEQARRWFTPRRHPSYTEQDVAWIVGIYAKIGEKYNLDWFMALAQMAHETADLTSFWCRRSQRNPAGIGVTGDWQKEPPVALSGWAYNTDKDRQRWERGISFPTWADDSIPAHLGRLLAYALTDAQATLAQRQLIAEALTVRPLPLAYRGAATSWHGLDGRWNAPGTTGYGARIVAKAQAMRGGA